MIMDPNAALAAIRSALAELDENVRSGHAYDHTSVFELIESVTGLDGWLSKGGFLPTDWSR
jgi:hypothetical protein